MASLRNGYVINPEPFWRPCYRISPFQTQFVKINSRIIKNAEFDEQHVKNHFPNPIIPTISGRAAIRLALSFYNLKKDDEVWILTTSGNRYISGCVTGEIERFCKWSMQKSRNTKLIFINHEFGFCFDQFLDLERLGIPIIEDCAYGFSSKDKEGRTGITGDFTIYSLPKFFPVAFGGILQCNKFDIKKETKIDNELQKSFFSLMHHYLQTVELIKLRRIENYEYLVKKFADDGIKPFFKRRQGEIPGVFMFKHKNGDLPGLKVFMHNNGVESSVFYGTNAFYIPVHQELLNYDLDFIHFLVCEFLKYGDK
jgi:hypothetical protein